MVRLPILQTFWFVFIHNLLRRWHLGTCNISLYISQLIRDSKTCCSYYDFLYKRLLLTRKLLNQGFLMVKLKASFRKFYGRRYDLRNIYFYKSPWICFVCHNPNPVLSSLMTNHWVYNKGNTTSQLWSRNCPTLPEHLNTSQFLVGFVLVMQSLVFFCVVCCRSLFVFLSFVLTCTSIFTVRLHFPFGISKQFILWFYDTNVLSDLSRNSSYNIYAVYLRLRRVTPNVRRNKGFKDLQSSRLFGWDKHSIH